MKTKVKAKTISFRAVLNEELKDPKKKKDFEEGYKNFLISELVHSLMQDDEISVRELAKALNISTKTITLIRGGKENPRIDTLKKILNYLGAKIQIVKEHKVLATI